MGETPEEVPLTMETLKYDVIKTTQYKVAPLAGA